MQLPENFTVPSFVLDNVIAAPDEWPQALSTESAMERLKQINVLMQNPDFLYATCQIVKRLSTAEAAIDGDVESIGDAYAQQQVIGERRGLRQFFTELNDIRNKLIQVIQPA